MANTQIATGKVRFSYLNVFEPKAHKDGDTPKYSATLIIRKDDKDTISKIKNAINAAKAAYTEKTGKKLSADLKTTLHDGDGVMPNKGEEYGPECKGAYVMSVSSKQPPLIVYSDRTPITDPRELFSGCYGRAVLNFYVYNNSGNVGVSAGLNGLMKLYDGEPLGGAVVTDKTWEDGWTDDDDDNLDDLLS